MGYRLRRVQNAKPLKKLAETDAVFADVATCRAQYQGDSRTLEISVDTKVNDGEYSRGEECRTDSQGQATKGVGHDPPAQRNWARLGILVLATGALTLNFSTREISDSRADGLQLWCGMVRGQCGHIKRLVIYLDNRPKNAGNRTQWLKRMIAFADWSGLETRLVYYPAYHSKYNPIEHC